MNGWLDTGVWVFVFVTVVLGGAAAYASGRAIARTWQSIALLVFYCALLACAVRFLHFALFDGTLLSLPAWLTDFAVMLAAGLLGFRLTRVTQMVTQYPWLYERAGPFGWRPRATTAPQR
ncbi:MAG TPA: hypothetical protein PKA84_10840 [Rubrivivax sp.]|jgi:hypothetical protein|nr:hypothetical protein [Burkholderiaceae bacterium]MCP5288773.1 hypothetical protein [Burkholderiaceae bacterium]HMQ71734.1 hypothetical protein [Rubrivivax sp.]HMR70717.1 hypothetical protein [Rubrivivax sp.]